VTERNGVGRRCDDTERNEVIAELHAWQDLSRRRWNIWRVLWVATLIVSAFAWYRAGERADHTTKVAGDRLCRNINGLTNYAKEQVDRAIVNIAALEKANTLSPAQLRFQSESLAANRKALERLKCVP
jgi:hypothetical protein